MSYSCHPYPIFLTLIILTLFPKSSLQAQEPLRALAAKHKFHVGAAVGAAFWGNDARYREVLTREYNVLVAENEMKASFLQPSRGNFSWNKADELVQFAEDNGMKVRGHALVWHTQVGWMENLQADRNEMLTVMREHIEAVAGRYKGRIWEWDVVNEAIDDGNAIFRNTFWLQRIGEDYIDSAFHFAHRADPNALLYYNDYSSEDMGAKSNKVYALVKGLKERGVPIHGVGFQCHFESAATWPAFSGIDANMQRLQALGLKISLTEVDFRMQMPPDAASLAQQKQKYQDLMQICLANANCTSFLTWGVTDAHSWVPHFFTGMGAALPFDSNYQPKPAYEGLSEALSQPPMRVKPRGSRGTPWLHRNSPRAYRIDALGRLTPAQAPVLSWQ